jgi:general secretion pathway protein D
VTPAFPDAFESRDIGVTLEVEPIVGADSYTIDLNLSPEVVDFDGFIDYGSPITNVGYVSGFFNSPILGVPVPADIPVASVLTNNVINQPIFSVRRVRTNVTIWDGQTVALGGLIREDTQKVEDKVPILGDVPLAGRLFRSNVDQKIKKNLVIFVTAQIIDAEGRPIRRDEEEEDMVDPLGLPETLPGPSFPAFKGSSK